MKKSITIFFVFIIAFIIGFFSNHYWNFFSKKTSRESYTQSKKKILYWVAPMDPNYRRNNPGKSPMGMDLVPVYAGEENQVNKDIVKISPAIENNLGVKTVAVKRIDLPRTINTVGYITVDENNIEHIHTYTDGWVSRLEVKTTGALVKKGELLMELYSPTLNNAQEEFLLALKNNNILLIKAGEKKLLTLGMDPSQIRQLKKTRQPEEKIKIYASQGGIISDLNVREGMYVTPDRDLITIEDLSQVWIKADIYEHQANWVKAGQQALATVRSLPEKTWSGKVDYVYPVLDSKTHTLPVRLIFSNPNFSLRPNMYADVKILSGPIKNVLVIPRLALIQTGEGARAILALGQGRFKAQTITIGIESGEYVQVLTGLKKGDCVVSSAQFLLDSESNIKAEFNRMKNSKD